MKTKYFLFTLVFFSTLSVFSQQEKRLPYELQKGIAGCDTVYTLPDEKAAYPGGISHMYNFFKKNLPPDQAGQLTNISFTRRQSIKLWVDKDGKVTKSEISVSLSSEYDEEVLRVVSLLPPFTPAKVNGRNVCSQLIFPLNYK